MARKCRAGFEGGRTSSLELTTSLPTSSTLPSDFRSTFHSWSLLPEESYAAVLQNAHLLNKSRSLSQGRIGGIVFE